MFMTTTTGSWRPSLRPRDISCSVHKSAIIIFKADIYLVVVVSVFLGGFFFVTLM